MRPKPGTAVASDQVRQFTKRSVIRLVFKALSKSLAS